jgi:hypothetical protein
MFKNLTLLSLSTSTLLFAGSIDKNFINSLEYGWHNLGADHNITDFSIFDYTYIVWKYENGIWKAYSSIPHVASQIETENVEKLVSLKANEGFWIKRDVGPTTTVANSSTGLGISKSTIDNLPLGWHNLGTGSNITNLSIFDSAFVVWNFQNSSWFGHSKNFNMSDWGHETLSSIEPNSAFWVLIKSKAPKFLNMPRTFTRDNVNNIVTDSTFDLKWEDSSHTETSVTFSEAETYCQNLELGGISNWRVPTNKELWYLADRSKHNPALNPTFQHFVSTNHYDKAFYWSNQQVTLSGYKNKSWGLNSYNGYDAFKKTSSGNGYVRCVSGNSHYEDIQFERDNSRNVVLDNTNNLMWQDGDLPNSMNFNNAISYCENLDYAGYSDWRLPTIEEFYSITDQRKSSAPFVNSEFRNIQSNRYWSNTKYNSRSLYSWGLNFYYGIDGDGYQSNSYYVRCLR